MIAPTVDDQLHEVRPIHLPVQPSFWEAKCLEQDEVIKRLVEELALKNKLCSDQQRELADLHKLNRDRLLYEEWRRDIANELCGLVDLYSDIDDSTGWRTWEVGTETVSSDLDYDENIPRQLGAVKEICGESVKLRFEMVKWDSETTVATYGVEVMG